MKTHFPRKLAAALFALSLFTPLSRSQASGNQSDAPAADYAAPGAQEHQSADSSPKSAPPLRPRKFKHTAARLWLGTWWNSLTEPATLDQHGTAIAGATLQTSSLELLLDLYTTHIWSREYVTASEVRADVAEVTRTTVEETRVASQSTPMAPAESPIIASLGLTPVASTHSDLLAGSAPDSDIPLATVDANRYEPAMTATASSLTPGATGWTVRAVGSDQPRTFAATAVSAFVGKGGDGGSSAFSDPGGSGGVGPNGQAGGSGSGTTSGSGGGGGGAGSGASAGGAGGVGGVNGGAGGSPGTAAHPNGGDGADAGFGSTSGGGGGGGGYSAFSGVLLSNAGTLTGGAGGSGGRGPLDGYGGGGGGGEGGYGAVITGAGISTNSGTVRGGTGGGGGAAGDFGGDFGNGGDGGVGAYFTASGATLNNTGQIYGGDGGFSLTGGAGGVGVLGSNLTITNSGTISGGVNSDDGNNASAIVFESGTNKLTLSSGGTVGTLIGDIAVTDSLSVDPGTAAGVNVTLDNRINDATGIGSLIKIGPGTLTLSADNSYTGGTTVSAGTLLASNTSGSATGSGAVGVNSTATLGGTGTISGAVTVNNGGTLSPGASAGQLNLSSDLTMNSGSTLKIEIGGLTVGSGYDQVQVAGALTLTSPNLVINLINGFTPSVGDKFYIVDLTGSTIPTAPLFGNAIGNLVMDSSGNSYLINYFDTYPGSSAGNDISLTFEGMTPVPEPSTWAAAVLASFAIAATRFRRFGRCRRLDSRPS